MGEKEWEPETIFDLLGDPRSRRILQITSEEPMSAEELADRLEVSLPTVYRRTDALANYNLIRRRTEISDDGNHYETFETALKQLTVELDTQGFDVDITLRQDLVDQFEAFWDGLNQTSPDVEVRVASDSDQDWRQSDGYDG